MKVDLLEIMESLLSVQSIQVLYLSPPYDTICSMDYQFRKRLYDGYDYTSIMKQLEDVCLPDVLVHIQDDFQLQYTAFQFPASLEKEYGYHYCLIGPILFYPLSSAEFYSVMHQKGIPVELYTETMGFYNRVPIFPSYESWCTQMMVYFGKLLGNTMQIHHAVRKESGMFLSDALYSINASPEIALSTIEERYRLETQMLNAVAAGNVEKALSAHQNFLQYRLIPRTPDPLRNRKNLVIVLNTLLRKIVQSASVHPLHIDNLSSQIAIQIESATNLYALSLISDQIIRKYCLLVKNYSRKSYSALVQTCLDYIDFHYPEELSLNSMAHLCCVSNSYLSSLFKKEVEMTLTDYMNDTRIREALILLNTTTLPIQDIAVQCGFMTANYFSRTFKKFQGMSPKAYRDLIR